MSKCMVHRGLEERDRDGKGKNAETKEEDQRTEGRVGGGSTHLFPTLVTI